MSRERIECQGHEPEGGMGDTVYCDGTCRGRFKDIHPTDADCIAAGKIKEGLCMGCGCYVDEDLLLKLEQASREAVPVSDVENAKALVESRKDVLMVAADRLCRLIHETLGEMGGVGVSRGMLYMVLNEQGITFDTYMKVEHTLIRLGYARTEGEMLYSTGRAWQGLEQ